MKCMRSERPWDTVCSLAISRLPKSSCIAHRGTAVFCGLTSSGSIFQVSVQFRTECMMMYDQDGNTNQSNASTNIRTATS